MDHSDGVEDGLDPSIPETKPDDPKELFRSCYHPGNVPLVDGVNGRARYHHSDVVLGTLELHGAD